jgi:hypothetical protein
MRNAKTIFDACHREAVPDQQARELALEYLAHAWNAAEGEGVETVALAHASLFAGLAMLVRLHGEEATAALVEALPARLRQGEYTLDRNLQ